MPLGAATLYHGDYIAPLSLDGYYPLYAQEVTAAKASDSGVAQSHGPGSLTGHPMAWSTGEFRLYYMPAEGPTRYYGTYLAKAGGTGDVVAVGASLYAGARNPVATAGEGPDQAAAAKAVLVATMPSNTVAAQATLAAAPPDSWFVQR